MGWRCRMSLNRKEIGMDNVWKYKIAIKSQSVFDEIEKERGIKFPEELKNFIMEYNAATPTKYKFMIGTTEKVLGAVLCFNSGEEDVDSVFSALSIVKDNHLLPFAIDSFGNYICYEVSKREIVFWEHETEVVVSAQKGLYAFIKSLYE